MHRQKVDLLLTFASLNAGLYLCVRPAVQLEDCRCLRCDLGVVSARLRTRFTVSEKGVVVDCPRHFEFFAALQEQLDLPIDDKVKAVGWVAFFVKILVLIEAVNGASGQKL